VRNDAFHAYADGVEFFSDLTGVGIGNWKSGTTATYSFLTPVTTLKFTDSGRGEVEVDTLVVAPAPVPEPGTLLLLGFGVASMALFFYKLSMARSIGCACLLWILMPGTVFFKCKESIISGLVFILQLITPFP
jgi:hypothetical protein